MTRIHPGGITSILHVQGFFVACWSKCRDHAVSSTFSVTCHKHVLFVCCDIFSCIVLIFNNIWKFKTESSSLGTTKFLRNTDVYAFVLFIVH